MENEKALRYKPKTKSSDKVNILLAAVIPIAIFGLALYSINSLGAFGYKLMAPLSSICWIAGVAVAFYMPSERHKTLKETYVFIAGYFGGILLLKAGIAITSGVSAEMISASFDRAIPASVGNALPGYLQTAMLITSVMGPIGFLGMQGKRFVTLKRNRNMQKAFASAQGIRNVGREHIDNYLG